MMAVEHRIGKDRISGLLRCGILTRPLTGWGSSAALSRWGLQLLHARSAPITDIGFADHC
jgi:hypothetical protein